MTTALLQTKLFIPRRPRGLVRRTRLIERLNRGFDGKLTLVAAPAGFGKTTLLAETLADAGTQGRDVAWLSLDDPDNHSSTYWSYLVAALQTAVPITARTTQAIGEATQTSSIETGLVDLVNELSALPNDVVMVLDDYHHIEAHDIQDAMRFLLEHLPPNVHLVIATRVDPALPLARYRARGELTEVRGADLRFTTDEAAEYLNAAMGLELAASDIAALEARTEGWIAALQLAALSMQGRQDVAGFVSGFTGDDRYIVDYLVEEVLQRQSESARSFLLETSILSRLSGPLTDAVTGRKDGTAMLEMLDRGNVFLVPLDDQRQWYRYHQLFADVLRARLTDEQPGSVPELHRRASIWFEKNSEPIEALHYAMAGKDYERAADLLELTIPRMRQHRQEAMMRALLESLPPEVVHDRPVLSLHFAGALLVSGEVEGVEGHLRDAERGLAQPIGTRVLDAEEFRRLPRGIAIYRAAVAMAMGDVEAATSNAETSLALVDGDDDLGRGAAAGFLGLTHWTRGDLETAHGYWSLAMRSLEAAGHISDALGCAIALADIRMEQGGLRDAMRTYERGLGLADDTTQVKRHGLRGSADMHVGMSAVLRERGDLAGAGQQLVLSDELGDGAALAQNPYRWNVAKAMLLEAEADLDGALEHLDEAERTYTSDYFPNVRPISALRARLWIAHGELDGALRWARELNLSADDDLSYMREFEHITLARLLLAQSTDATALLGRLQKAAEQGQRTRSVIELLVLQAREQARTNGGAALDLLGRAIELAAPEGFVRIFIDEGQPIEGLLQEFASRGRASGYAGRLLTASGKAEPTQIRNRALVEPLSERELEVLRLLATDLDGPGIASGLFVSLHTVRSHTKSIYAKLDVNSRRAAVSRAHELGLLGSRPS